MLTSVVISLRSVKAKTAANYATYTELISVITNFSIRWTATVRASYLFPGGDAEGATPVPIPNTEVKSFWADGTAGETLWESRMLPGFFSRAAQHEQS